MSVDLSESVVVSAPYRNSEGECMCAEACGATPRSEALVCRKQVCGQIYDSMRSQAGLRKSMFKAQAHCRRLQLCSRHILTYLLYQARKRLVYCA